MIQNNYAFVGETGFLHPAPQQVCKIMKIIRNNL